MTPQERAEKIRLELRKTENSFPMTEEAFDALIAAEIQAAVEESVGQYRDELLEVYDSHGRLARRTITQLSAAVNAAENEAQIILDAKADAYADAAKLLAGHYASCPSCHGGRCIDELKNAIRARAAEVCGLPKPQCTCYGGTQHSAGCAVQGPKPSDVFPSDGGNEK